MPQLNNPEKINIYVPESVGTTLLRDAELFEILKKNGQDVNLNRFLSQLLLGYFPQYRRERDGRLERIRSLLDAAVPDAGARQALAEALLDRTGAAPAPERPGKHAVRLSLKPTADTDRTLTEILLSLGAEDSVSRYLCRLLTDYCEKPLPERERLVFREASDFLEAACGRGQEIVFTTTTRPGCLHRVLPWAFTCGPEEMFNYLLCQEYNGQAGRFEPATYRLARIVRPARGLSSVVPDERVIRCLEQMKRLGPQYVIREDTETCVRLTEKGRIGYRMIYFGRPAAERTEQQPDGSALYYFRSSQDQLFRYFRRFNPGEAEILYPESLRQRLCRFFRNSLKACGEKE